MPQVLPAIGSLFTSGGGLMKLLTGGLAASGEIGNILADKQRSNLMSQEQKWASLTPQQLSAKIAAATQPLSQGLVNSVGNTVQADVGERGLSQAPGIFSGELAQSLAPFQQQNQATALQAILKQMGLPLEMASLLPGQTNLAPLLALIMGQNKPSGGGTPNFSGLPQVLTQGADATPVTQGENWQLPGTFDISNIDPTALAGQ